MLREEQQANVNTLVYELISGKYEQGEGALKQRCAGGTSQYCCLGVAAEGVLGRTFRLGAGHSYMYGEQNFGFLSHEDAKKFGFNTRMSQVEAEMLDTTTKALGYPAIGLKPGTDRETALMHLNDWGITFNEIASIILAMNWNKE